MRRSAAGCGTLPTPGGLKRWLAAVDLPGCRVVRSFHPAPLQRHSSSGVSPQLAAHGLFDLGNLAAAATAAAAATTAAAPPLRHH